jgi:hypothetical protein
MYSPVVVDTREAHEPATPAAPVSFPAALTAVAGVPFEYGEDGVDYEPFEDFLSADETTEWLRSWTGNTTLDGNAFRVFGQDGTGGYAAFWLVRPDRPLHEQPVVFLGSEGETGVVAQNLAAYLWLLADGSGPLEAVEFPGHHGRPNPELRAIAETHAPGAPRSAADLVAAARAEFPDFPQLVEALCR